MIEENYFKINNNLKTVEFTQTNGKCNVVLREINAHSHRKYPRSFIISISYKDNSYSIKSFEIRTNPIKEEVLREIYPKIEVKGENDKRSIRKDLKEIIEGKKRFKLLGSYPCSF